VNLVRLVVDLGGLDRSVFSRRRGHGQKDLIQILSHPTGGVSSERHELVKLLKNPLPRASYSITSLPPVKTLIVCRKGTGERLTSLSSSRTWLIQNSQMRSKLLHSPPPVLRGFQPDHRPRMTWHRPSQAGLPHLRTGSNQIILATDISHGR
jgi:hypothetical protein